MKQTPPASLYLKRKALQRRLQQYRAALHLRCRMQEDLMRQPFILSKPDVRRLMADFKRMLRNLTEEVRLGKL